jgi:cellobiose phosphorylase
MKSVPVTIDNPYGHYDAERREFVITRPDTPTPWINYLGEGRYGGIISNTAGGYSFDRDPRNRRVTRYRYNSIPVDQPGRYVYLRDQQSGEFWSPTWQPVVARELDAYECRHGAAYTRITGSYREIRAELLYFVPPSAPDETCPCELWVMRVRNTGSRPRLLRSFSYAELSFYDANVDQTNLDWGMHIVRSREQDGTLLAATQFRPDVTYFASSSAPIGFDSDRDSFLGAYRDLASPEVVERGEPMGSQAPCGNNIASLCHELGLAPGEEKTLVYMLGVTERPEQIARVVGRFSQIEQVDEALLALHRDWDEYLGKLSVETPDPELNAMVGFWNAVQCRSTLYWSRFVSGYDTGLGRGIGTRDSAQDTLATVHNLPDKARQMLTALFRLQFQDGHTWHQVFPLTGEGGPGLAGEIPEWPQWFSDDHLWLVLGTCAYLRETGDLGYLDERLPYQDAGEETVYEHIQRAVAFTLDNRGPHGLPRHGFSDWNDTMNIDHGSGKAESVWTGQQFCRAMLDLAELCDVWDKPDQAQRYRDLHLEMASIINTEAWDGEWYARAYDDEGKPLGVREARYNQISLNTQTWAVIGELGDEDRARRAMESAHQRLNTPFGVRVMEPPHDRYDRRIQGTTTFPPGAKENGGIFCHAHAWAIVAAAALGWGDRAHEYYREILPLARKDADVYKAEPYVYCQNICSPLHPQYGRGRNTWLTGTASWAYVAATQWILGIRPTFSGLRIEPVVPDTWAGFEVRRDFRGVHYEIRVERVGPGNGVSLTVDGRPVAGDVVPLPDPGTDQVQVGVELGGRLPNAR